MRQLSHFNRRRRHVRALYENLSLEPEGLFAEAPFRWAASNLPSLAKPLAKLDNMVGNGELNPIKKWWWDIELYEDGGYKPARKPVNAWFAKGP